MSRKLYPYWAELFDSLVDFSQSSSMGGRPTSQHLTAASDPRPDVTFHVQSALRSKSVNVLMTEFHMTIQAREKLAPKLLTMLLTVATLRGLAYGYDLGLYMATVFLLEAGKNLLKSRQTFDSDRTVKAVCLAELSLLGLSGDGWVGLDSVMEVHDRVKDEIRDTGWLPSDRTWRSWKEHYSVERFLELRIVPLEQYSAREQDTERYSGYTRGYHESGKGYRRDGQVYGVGKTPYDSEIDAVFTSEVDVRPHNLDADPTYQRITTIISRAKEVIARG